MIEPFVPDRGDIVWLEFNPQAGHEQAGRRPAIILSPRAYNETTGLALCCPITNRVKGYPFEVVLPAELAATGAVLSDHVKCLDWRIRNATAFCSASEDVVEQVRNNIAVLMGAS